MPSARSVQVGSQPVTQGSPNSMSKRRRPHLRGTTDQSQRFRRLGRATSVTAAVLTALYGPLAVADDVGLQEVIVTATRRVASAQDLPISITAVSGTALEQAGIEDVAELAHTMAGGG